MSTMVRVITALFLVLSLSFAVLGCDENGTTAGLSQEEIEKVVTDAVTANAGVDTLKFDMNMQMKMEMVAEGETGEITMVVDGNGAVDNVDREMQIMMNMAMDMPDQGEQDMAMEIYATDGWMYMGIDMPVIGKQWVKTELTQEMWRTQGQVEQQIELLRSATAVSFLGSEDVNGTACYVVEVVPSVEALSALLSQQQASGMEGLDFGQLDLADIFKEMSVKEWIAKDGYLLMKSEVQMLMEMDSGDLGAGESDLGKMTMDMNIVMEIYDYNHAVSIELPEMALQATEVPGM